jgi:hypothetical protein
MREEETVADLFSPTKVGAIPVANRIVMAPLTRVLKWMAFVRRWRSSITGSAPLRGSSSRKQSERGVPSDLIETVRWFSDTLDRTETSRTIVGVGLFNLGLGVHDKGTARDDRLMQWTTGIE